MHRPVRVLGLAVVGVLGALGALGTTACSSGGGSDSATETTMSASGSTPTSSTTTAAPSTTTTIPTPPSFPLAINWSSTGPAGSGCSPGGSTLPDGQWLGVLRTVDATAGTLGIDLVCIYTNPAARAAGVVPPDYPLNDYISNQSAQVFTIPAWPNVQVVVLATENGYPTGLASPPRTGIGAVDGVSAVKDEHYVWVQIVGGKAIAVQQLFRS